MTRFDNLTQGHISGTLLANDRCVRPKRSIRVLSTPAVQFN